MPRLVQVLVITVAILTGLAQTAINISFITDMIVILLGFFFGGLSLAFALGSRQLVENLLARRALDRYRIGDHVRLNDTQGRIIEILGTAVVLESSEGVITVPCARFVDSEVVLVNEEQGQDDAIGPS
jgi:small-conductance mechanosensitive channel